MFIYVIVCTESLKLYIGQHKGTDLGKYLSQKYYDANRWSGKRSHLFAAMRKHLRETWSIHPLTSDIETRQELDEWERLLIYACKAQHPDIGYNICDGGEGFTGQHSEESKAKTTASLKAFYADDEKSAVVKEKLRNIVYERQEAGGFIGRPVGYRHTAESVEKMSQLAQERLETPEGQAQIKAAMEKSKTPEALAKLSKALTGKPSSMRGIPRTEETKEKLRIANTGKRHSAETREKLSAALRGKPGRHTKPHSEETKQKLREIGKRKYLESLNGVLE